jgi:hydroxymethylbilane synthase
VRPIRTVGDKAARASLAEIGGRGVFIAELERALLSGDIDVAAHSLKDLPSQETAGLVIAAVAERDDPRDALVSRGGFPLQALPAGATIGTGSPRRASQLRAHRRDLRIVDIRGNVDTRLRKVQEGETDAVVLAAAGLVRLGWLDRAAEILPEDVILPAAGQGAVALQVRADDAEAVALARAIDHPPTWLATAAERAFLRRLGGGCHAAVAALGQVSDGHLYLRGLVADLSGARLLRGEIGGPAEEAEVVGVRLAEQLMAQGAGALLAASHGEARQ